MIHYSVFIIVEGGLKTEWVIVNAPLIPYFSCLGHIPKCCSRPRPNISHYKAVSVCECVLVVQPWPLMARVRLRPFVSFMVSQRRGLIICTRLCFDQIYFKLFSCLIWTLRSVALLLCWSVALLVTVGCMYGTCEAPHTVYTVRSTVVIGLNTGPKLNLLQGSDKFTACWLIDQSMETS